MWFLLRKMIHERKKRNYHLFFTCLLQSIHEFPFQYQCELLLLDSLQGMLSYEERKDGCVLLLWLQPLYGSKKGIFLETQMWLFSSLYPCPPTLCITVNLCKQKESNPVMKNKGWRREYTRAGINSWRESLIRSPHTFVPERHPPRRKTIFEQWP